MIYLLAIFVGAGGALIGWAFGSAVFAAVFEVLRLLHLEAPLDSPAALAAFRYAHAVAAIAAALWLLRRWRPRGDQAVPAWKVVLIATAAAMGCALLAVPVVILTFTHAQTITPFLVALVAALTIGASITAIVYGRSTSWTAIGVGSALASIIAIALLWLGFVFEVELSRAHAMLGQPRSVLIDIRIPHDPMHRPELATIRIAMRSEGRDLPGQPQFWFPPSDGGLLRVSVPLVIGTRDRTVVLMRPNEPERRLRIDLPTHPRRTRGDFGPRVRFVPAGDPPHEARYLIR